MDGIGPIDDNRPAVAAQATVQAAFDVERREGLSLAVRGRTFALIAIGMFLPTVAPWPDVLYYHALLAIFVGAGVVQYAVLKRTDAWGGWPYVFCLLDFALLSFTLIYPNPISDPVDISTNGYQLGNFIYFFVLMMSLTYTYEPRYVLLGGIIGCVCWLIGITWLASQPDVFVFIPDDISEAERARLFNDPAFLDIGRRIEEAVAFLITTSLMALLVKRSRRLVIRQVGLERERGNLARYFAPTIVDRLAQSDSPLSQIREQTVTVLFADVVGFTRWAEDRSPDEVIERLRGVHERLEAAVFRHGGTLDKFIGDGVMATFGTPEAGPDDAANALRSALDMLAAFDRWNADRPDGDADPVSIGIGVHTGVVVTGDIGSERRLEFAVLGDTVNVASRLERATRNIGCRLAVSDTTVEEADGTLPDEIRRHGPVSLPGRGGEIVVWTA